MALHLVYHNMPSALAGQLWREGNPSVGSPRCTFDNDALFMDVCLAISPHLLVVSSVLGSCAYVLLCLEWSGLSRSAEGLETDTGSEI